MKELRFWRNDREGIARLRSNIKEAVSQIEDGGYEEAIVEIHISDRVGRYIPQYLLTEIADVALEEDYPYEIGSEEEMIATDEIIEEINEELQELVEEYDLVPAGFAVYFGWNDGEIRTMLYPIS